MASVTESIKRFYTEKDALYNNIILLIMILAVIAVFVFIGGGSLESVSKTPQIKVYAYVLSTLISFFGAGYCLQIMNNRINDNDVVFNEINFSVFQTAFNAFGFFLVYGLISVLLNMIPIVGGLVSPFVTPPIFVKYAASFNFAYATQWSSTRELIRAMFVPLLILSFKMTVASLFLILPIYFFAAAFVKAAPAAIIFITLYVVAVMSLVYSDNLAQIYTEVADAYEFSDV